MIAYRQDMLTWKNTTSYCQSDTDRTPREWTIEINRLRAVIHRHMDYAPDMWFLTTHPDLFCRAQLETTDVDEAKDEALKLLRGCAEGILRDLQRAWGHE